MRPSSIGGGRILRRTLSVCLSVRLSVRPVILTERHVAPPSELQWHTCTFRHALTASVLFGTHWGPHIVYGHLGRTNSCYYYVKVMFAHLTVKKSQACWWEHYALMHSSVFSWRRNDTAESSSLRSSAGSAFHVLTAQRLQSCDDRNGLSS